MSTDLSKLASELEKRFPDRKPNGSSAPPPNVAPAIPPTGDVYKICGINKPHKD